MVFESGKKLFVGVTAILDNDEYILPMHRNLGVFTGRNIPLYRLFSQWQGKANGFTAEIEVFILERNNIKLLE
jgi:TPP-dependent pyruvate/acetoin dehydrogenase alpha subunit